MNAPPVTRAVAWAVATDAANDNARANGRRAWNADDWNVAANTFNALWQPPRPEEPCN